MARAIVDAAGSAWSAAISIGLAAMWLIVGFASGFTEHWTQILVAVTSVFTFIMVFLIQHTTGRESRALMLKLDELIRATHGARDELIAAEAQPLEEQERLESQLQDQASR
ncbi:low affinity iron permease family protein [Catelliglobosispora koreensis]|uniref:low affinity iron permease family protein n=1 Tax=Catelliglobosispora koreensis TaxID=129052 RepID=UPI0012FC2955|nr:low affinity iron permease family protein [Catelliglobosispora koreensis]